MRLVILEVTLPKRWFTSVMLKWLEKLLSFLGARKQSWNVMCALLACP